MQNYKDSIVWQKAHQFTLGVYEITKTFPGEELYSLTNQLRRAASSIPANIAEGCEKNKHAEFAHHLNISLGSANEAGYFLILSRELKYPNDDAFNSLCSIANEIKAMLIALIGKIRSG